MTRTIHPVPDVDPPDEHPDWAELFPADPELMASPEGDRKGLAELQATAHARIERLAEAESDGASTE